MMRPLGLLSTAAALAILAAPAAMAGNDIVRCVDPQGRVTLTDQPCESRSASVRVAGGAVGPNGAVGAVGASTAGDTGSGGPEAYAERPAPQRHIVPAAELRHATWRRPAAAAQAAPLARDVATLKAAHRALTLMENPPTSLAGLP